MRVRFSPIAAAIVVFSSAVVGSEEDATRELSPDAKEIALGAFAETEKIQPAVEVALTDLQAAILVLESNPDFEGRHTVEAALKSSLSAIEGLSSALQAALAKESTTNEAALRLLTSAITDSIDKAPKPEVKVGDKVEEVRFSDGTLLQQVTIKSLTPASAVLLHSKGVARVELKMMDEENRRVFGYSPLVAGAAEKKENAEMAALLAANQQRGQDAKQGLSPQKEAVAEGDAPPINPKPGLNLYGIGARQVGGKSSNYVYVSWKVSVLNNSETDVGPVSLEFLFLDDMDFEIERELEYPLRFAPGETRVITGQAMIEAAEWPRVSSYSVRTQ